MSIRIVTDSASDMANGDRNDVTVLPLKVRFGEEEFMDGVDISHKEFYEKLIETEELPITSQATPYDFEKVYKEAALSGDTLIVITLSSKLSGTYQSAVVAAADYDNIYVAKGFKKRAYIVGFKICILQKTEKRYTLLLTKNF